MSDPNGEHKTVQVYSASQMPASVAAGANTTYMLRVSIDVDDLPPDRDYFLRGVNDDTPQVEMAEYVKCIAHTHADKTNQSWCGRNTSAWWTFMGIDHAAYNALAEGRLVTCPDCVAAVLGALGDEGSR